MESGTNTLTDKITVVIAGAGAVATHLAKALASTERYRVIAVASRTKTSAMALAANIPGATACDYDEITAHKPSLVIVSVPDHAVGEVATWIGRLPDTTIAVHTSGTLPVDALHDISHHCGILYPFQTFTRGFDVDMSRVPFFIEASDCDTYASIDMMAHNLSDYVFPCDDVRRGHLHVAGVFASNFINVLLEVVYRQLDIAGYPHEVSSPLIAATIEKAESIGTMAAQTGPAKRGDVDVMIAQIDRLDDRHKPIYSLLSNIIFENHHSVNEQDKLRFNSH